MTAKEYYREWEIDKHYMGDEEDWATCFAEDFADEQVKKSLSGRESYKLGFKEGTNKALEEVEKSLMSDEERKLEICHPTIQIGARIQANKTQSVIDNLKTK